MQLCAVRKQLLDFSAKMFLLVNALQMRDRFQLHVIQRVIVKQELVMTARKALALIIPRSLFVTQTMELGVLKALLHVDWVAAF
jgi:hypothetical protein